MDFEFVHLKQPRDSWRGCEPRDFNQYIPSTRKPTIFLRVGYQLDDEPNLYMGNGWKSPCPSTLTGCLGFQVAVLIRGSWVPGRVTPITSLTKKMRNPPPLDSRLYSYILGCPPSQDASGKRRFRLGSPILKIISILVVTESPQLRTNQPRWTNNAGYATLEKTTASVGWIPDMLTLILHEGMIGLAIETPGTSACKCL